MKEFLLDCFFSTAEKEEEKREGVKYLDVLDVGILFTREMKQNSRRAINMCLDLQP